MLTEFNSKTNIKITGKRVNMSLENKIFKYDKKELYLMGFVTKSYWHSAGNGW